MPTTFTIAVPTHNRCETAVLAIRSCLGQTRPPEQVIVLCDGCTDGTVEAVRSLGDPRVEALELPKLPGFAYANRNRAIALARGEVIMWLADDDLLLPDHLERIGEYWDSGSADIVAAATVIVGKDDELTWCGRDLSVSGNRALMMVQNTNVMTAFSVPVSLARDVGGWDGSQARCGDWDLWKRVLHAGARPAMTSEPTVLHFPATEREQAWTLRVRQNSEWFERMNVDADLAKLRRHLRRARSVHEAAIEAHRGELTTYASGLEMQADELRLELADLRAQTEMEVRQNGLDVDGGESLREGLLRLLVREGERIRAGMKARLSSRR